MIDTVQRYNQGVTPPGLNKVVGTLRRAVFWRTARRSVPATWSIKQTGGGTCCCVLLPYKTPASLDYLPYPLCGIRLKASESASRRMFGPIWPFDFRPNLAIL